MLDIRYIIRNGEKVLQQLVPCDIHQVTDEKTGKEYLEFTLGGSKWVDVKTVTEKDAT